MTARRWVELERLRKDAGHTTASLGRACGLTQHYIWMIENGDRRGSPTTLAKIARVFGMTATQLEATRPDQAPMAEVA